MYKCRFFEIHELVPPKVFSERGYKAWELMDDRALITLDNLRQRYGPITCNNYHWNGPRQWSGLRTPDSPYYSPFSQHSFGRAVDCVFKNITAEEVRKDILEYRDDHRFGFITSIELETSWLHFDVRNCERIKTYRG